VAGGDLEDLRDSAQVPSRRLRHGLQCYRGLRRWASSQVVRP
jgi:hypothetical protein